MLCKYAANPDQFKPVCCVYINRALDNLDLACADMGKLIVICMSDVIIPARGSDN